MAPEATRSAAPAIPYSDRRGTDAPIMLPTTLITRWPASRFNGVYNETVVSPRGIFNRRGVIGLIGGYREAADHQGDGGHQAAPGRGAAGVRARRPAGPAVSGGARAPRGGRGVRLCTG